jgi:predicted O-methyltransferase YrrM
VVLPEDAVLTEALRACEAAGLPSINVSPPQGKLLWLIAKLHGAKRILEIGTLGGYSSIWLARALPADGALVTLEFEPKHVEVARANLERAGLSKIATVREGDAHKTLAEMVRDDTPPFDLVFVDAEKTGYPDYLDWALKLTRKGSVIIADNVVRGGKVIEPDSSDANVQGVRAYLKALSACKDISTTVIQTVGAKGHDGFAFSILGG